MVLNEEGLYGTLLSGDLTQAWESAMASENKETFATKFIPCKGYSEHKKAFFTQHSHLAENNAIFLSRYVQTLFNTTKNKVTGFQEGEAQLSSLTERGDLFPVQNLKGLIHFSQPLLCWFLLIK